MVAMKQLSKRDGDTPERMKNSHSLIKHPNLSAVFQLSQNNRGSDKQKNPKPYENEEMKRSTMECVVEMISRYNEKHKITKGWEI